VLAKLSIATSDIYKNKEGEKVKETYWHNLIAWGKTATFIQNYVQKGQEIAVEGKLTNRSYDDKDGKKHYITEINVNELMLMVLRNRNFSESLQFKSHRLIDGGFFCALNQTHTIAQDLNRGLWCRDFISNI